MGVGCPCPPIRNDIVTPLHLSSYSKVMSYTDHLSPKSAKRIGHSHHGDHGLRGLKICVAAPISQHTMHPGNRQDDFWITVSFSFVLYSPEVQEPRSNH